MPLVAWVTVIAFVLVIAVTAVALLLVILHLNHVAVTLWSLIGGVRAIADSTSTVPQVLPSVNANLKPVRDFCESV
ncbi:MAG: hypothetical protein ACRD0K_15650 [Egibacteraceae bacterium]